MEYSTLFVTTLIGVIMIGVTIRALYIHRSSLRHEYVGILYACFMFIFGLFFLMPISQWLLNPAVSTDTISKLVKGCPEVGLKIEGRTEILKLRELNALYSDCRQIQKGPEEEITIENQKAAAMRNKPN